MRRVDLVSTCADYQHRHLGQQRCEVFGQQQRGFVGPMQVLEYEQQRLRLRTAGDELVEAVPQVPPGELWRQLHGLRYVGKKAAQRWSNAGDLWSNVTKRLPQRQWAARAGNHMLDHLPVRQIRRCAVNFYAVAG